MSYNTTNLSVLAYANNFTLWHYTTTDSAVTGAGYFNAASDLLRINDMIICSTDTSLNPVTRFYIVTGVRDGEVTISPVAA